MTTQHRLRSFLAAAIALVAPHAMASVEISPGGFLVRHELVVSVPAPKLYEALTGQIGSWWNEQHTYSGDAKNLSIDARAGGCFCERLSDGAVEHMRVVHVRQNQLIRMVGGLGPLQGSGVSGALTWRLSTAEKGTKLELIYSVGGFISGGFDSMAPAVDRVLGEQVERLKRFVEKAG